MKTTSDQAELADVVILPISNEGRTVTPRPRGGSPDCPNPVILHVEDTDDMVRSVARPCSSRRCSECRHTVDVRDTARILASSQSDDIFWTTVDLSDWSKLKRRAQRHNTFMVKMASVFPGMIEVVTDNADLLENSQRIGPGKVESLVQARPIGTKVNLSGPSLISIADWERPERDPEPARTWVGPSRSEVTVGMEIEMATELGLNFFSNRARTVIHYLHTWEELEGLRNAIVNFDTARGWS